MTAKNGAPGGSFCVRRATGRARRKTHDSGLMAACGACLGGRAVTISRTSTKWSLARLHLGLLTGGSGAMVAAHGRHGDEHQRDGRWVLNDPLNGHGWEPKKGCTKVPISLFFEG